MSTSERVLRRYLAAKDAPTRARGELTERGSEFTEESIAILKEELAKEKLTLTDVAPGGKLFALVAPGPMKLVDLRKQFAKAWAHAASRVYQETTKRLRKEEEAFSKLPDWKERFDRGLDPKRAPGIGSSRMPPKIILDDQKPRDTEGKYMHSKWTRLCKCGHPVGAHLAHKPQACIAADFVDIDPCPCEQFRPTNQFMPDEEYVRAYGPMI